jgi:hypothetical protein
MKQLRLAVWFGIVLIFAIGLAAGRIEVSGYADILALLVWFGSIAFIADMLTWGTEYTDTMKLETIEETEVILTDRYTWGTITRCTACGGERRMVTSGNHDALDREQVEIFIRRHAFECEHWFQPFVAPLPAEMIRQFAVLDYDDLAEETGRDDEALGYLAWYMAWIRGSNAPLWNSITHHSRSSFMEWAVGDSKVVLGVIQGNRPDLVHVRMDVKEPGGDSPFATFAMDINDPSAIGRKLYDVLGPKHN